MSKTTRLRFSASAIERLAFPADAALSIKTVEFSDLDCHGLKLSIARAGSKTFWFILLIQPDRIRPVHRQVPGAFFRPRFPRGVP